MRRRAASSPSAPTPLPATRYENGKVVPGLEAVIRIAETFNVSVDCLVI